MRLFLFLSLTLIGCNPMFPTYKLSDETQGLKYHSLIPVHSLPTIDTITKENKFNDADKDAKIEDGGSGAFYIFLKNKNKYSSKKVSDFFVKICNKK